MGHKAGNWNKGLKEKTYVNRLGQHKTQGKREAKDQRTIYRLGEHAKTADSKGQNISRPATGGGECHEK